jgi:hypothetical protein
MINFTSVSSNNQCITILQIVTVFIIGSFLNPSKAAANQTQVYFFVQLARVIHIVSNLAFALTTSENPR